MSRRSRKRLKAPIRAKPPPKGVRIRTHFPHQRSPPRGWQEISHVYGYQPGSRPRKLKLCSDSDVPQVIVETLKESGIPVETALESNMDGADDQAIVAWVKRRKRVLLTFNHRDFWNDQKHPLQMSPGMIIVAIPNSLFYEAATALDMLDWSFARHFSLGWWNETKARVMRNEYIIRTRFEGQKVQFRVRSFRDRLYFRQL